MSMTASESHGVSNPVGCKLGDLAVLFVFASAPKGGGMSSADLSKCF